MRDETDRPAPEQGGLDGDVIDLDEDVIDVGKDWPTSRRLTQVGDLQRRVPRIVWWAVAVLVAGGLVVHELVRTEPHRVKTPTPVSLPRVLSPSEEVLASVRAVAQDTDPLQSYVRNGASPGACSDVPVGAAPIASMARIVRRSLPDFGRLEFSLTLDQSTALCFAVLRAHDAAGTTLVVTVSAPAPPGTKSNAPPTNAVDSDGVTATEYGSAVTATGWTITVGATGPAADQLRSTDLQRVASDPGMPW